MHMFICTYTYICDIYVYRYTLPHMQWSASKLSLSLHFYTNYSAITSTYLEFSCKISQIYKVLCEVFWSHNWLFVIIILELCNV